jgi:hypothetical protein
VSNKCFQLSDRLLAIATPLALCHFSPLTVTFPKLRVILRPLYFNKYLHSPTKHSCVCSSIKKAKCDTHAHNNKKKTHKNDPQIPLYTVHQLTPHLNIKNGVWRDCSTVSSDDSACIVLPQGIHYFYTPDSVKFEITWYTMRYLLLGGKECALEEL